MRFTRRLVTNRYPVRATTTSTATLPTMERRTPCFVLCLLIHRPFDVNRIPRIHLLRYKASLIRCFRV